MYRAKMFLKFIVLFMILETISANSVPVVHSKLGDINGKSITTEFNGKVYTINRYAGLRYAKAPIDELRFQKPVPFGDYDSPFNASEFASACPQNDVMRLGVESVDEDCLSLSIYVPTENPDRPEGFAVMIFIHGGGFSMGASHAYPGEVFAGLGNVILVNINYRLGLLGFANSGDGQIVGNFGLWDQQMAFRWVKDNIESFGGDASRITIFGESAGGASSMMQGLYPANKGLFHNIIAESGTPTTSYRLVTSNLDNMEYVADKLGCPTETTNHVIKCLQNIKTADLMAKLAELSMDVEGAVMSQFMPTIDGDFIKKSYLDLIADSKRDSKNEQIEFFRSLNLINGINTAEGALLLMMLGGQDLETVVISKEEMTSAYVPNMMRYFIDYEYRVVPKTVVDVIVYEYTDFESLDNFREPFVNFVSDFYFTVSGREWIDVHANSTASNTYFYSFDADLEIKPLPTPSWVKGANHGDEVMPVFGFRMSTSVGAGAMQNLTDYTPPAWELELSDRMITYWTNFAKTGSPNGNGESDLLTWPQSEADDTAYIVFSNEDSVRHDNLYGKAVTFWRETVPTLWDTIDGLKCHTNGSPYAKGSETCGADGNCD